ncbi:hypothetical protein ACOSP7_027286 [Xanthoceras sorbifolium]|uniref:Hydroxyproline-rich glycoprotein family protein n=1 Tax=Xanthoceras sorbifolium TaxID=99658 RepID=A0ABQ8HFX0_9ROSI|nr:hypothetical protein JRO89_XS11G0167400 [Xanthoceras sorbifolium]
MADINVTQYSKTRKIRQPPAVPFLWEVKPGMPIKDWKPEETPVIPVLAPPAKLVASIPFDWEEKPGTPLPCFSQPPLESILTPPPEKLISISSPLVCYQGYDDDADEERKRLSELDLEAFDFETDDSFSSVPSLLANCLVPSVDISSAVPVQKSSSGDDTSDQLEIPSSPASKTDSSTSSYATGISSLVGASFLECLFPLLPPNAGFLEKVGCSEKGFHTPADGESKDFDHERNSSVVIRRPTTLGELIMMSRRRSYHRKAAQMRKRNLSMEFGKRTSGCGIFGTSFKMIDGLQRKMRQPILKLL